MTNMRLGLFLYILFAVILNGNGQLYDDSVFFSVQGGKHIGGLTLILTSNNPGKPIYFTTNGSVPTSSDILYKGPILINHDTVIKARVISGTAQCGAVFTNTYVTTINHEFPIVCLSTDSINLWDYQTGIFANGPNASGKDPFFGANFWQDWERVVHFEFYDRKGIKQIDQDAGMKVFGAYSRAREQKSIVLYARKKYGKGSFKYKFFDTKPIDKFESIVLRNSGNDYWGLRFQDEFLTGLTDKMDIDKQAFQPAVVYLNGKYWGILNIREKVNEHFISENHSVDPDKVNIVEIEGIAVVGSNQKYQEILDFLNTHTTLEDEKSYNWVADKIDIDNYIQYKLFEIYIFNRDCNNIKYWNTNSPASKWRWILFDTDSGFGMYEENYDNNTLEFALDPDFPGDWPNPPWSTLLFRRLISNTGFRHNFINQYADRINTDFKPEIIINKLDSFKLLYKNEVKYHFGRWRSDNDWLLTIDQRKKFAALRPAFARDHIQSFFKLGRQLEINIEVSSVAQGTVKLNSIIPDSYPFTGIYFEGVPVKLTAIPKPGYKFEKWEGTISSTDMEIFYDMGNKGNFKAVFTDATASDISLVINEINYNSSITYPSKDWIELFNNGLTTIDLTGWGMCGSDTGSYYVFPTGTTIAPQEYLVIYTNLKKFKTTYPNVTNICGSLPFGLSSKSEKIMLFNSDHKLVDFVKYSSSFPWDTRANGSGATLQLLGPNYDNSLASSWKAGILGGSPGNKNTW
jgi:hypothetical protein